MIVIHIGVWLLVLVFTMTSGVLCLSLGGSQQTPRQVQQAQQDPVQVEIDRRTREVGASPSDPVALADRPIGAGADPATIQAHRVPRFPGSRKSRHAAVTVAGLSSWARGGRRPLQPYPPGRAVSGLEIR